MDCSETPNKSEDEEMTEVYLPASPITINDSSGDDSPPQIKKKRRRVVQSDSSDDEDSTPKVMRPI